MHSTGIGWNHTTPGVIRRCWPQPSAISGHRNSWCYQCTETNEAQPWDWHAAPRLLHPHEVRVWWRQPSDAARRRWLRGRLAAKDAVRQVILDHTGEVVTMETVAVLPDPQGQPRVDNVPNIPTALHVSVSISHCGATSAAIAAVTPRENGIGLDIASRADNHEGLAEGGFSASEIALLPGDCRPERDRWLLHMWCAKEAAGKAMGSGLHGDPMNFIVIHLDASRNTILVQPRLGTPAGADASSPRPIPVAIGGDGTAVFAVAGGPRLP